MPEREIIIIGAGPGGLFCAIHAAGTGFRVTVLEKNPAPGAKLLISGSGQCNLTHTGDVQEFLRHYGDHGKFLKPALHALTGPDLVAFFGNHGLAVQAEENGKIFPATRKAADVLSVLVAACKERGVVIRCGEPVTALSRSGDLFCAYTGKGRYPAAAVVIATGGASYPRCGTTGDGYLLAENLGQPVTEIGPALTPLLIRPFPFAALAGLSFERARFSVWRSGKKIADHTGDLLFTHLGLSGPGILDASRGIRPGDVIRLSFVSPLRREELTADIAKRAAENPGWQVGTLLAKYPIPERLNRRLLELSGIPLDLTGAHFSAALRSVLVTNCTEFPLTVADLGNFNVAMVTRGGISLDGVSSRTMESKIVPGLFFAGEVLDIDGDTGGFNLQAAFSTGYLAAQGIRKRLSGCPGSRNLPEMT